MTYGIFDLLLLGMFVVSIALVAITSMVNSELGPVSQLKKNQRFFLMTALGSGVLTFAAKLLVIAGFVNLSSPDSSYTPKTFTASVMSNPPPSYRFVALPEVKIFSSHNAQPLLSRYVWQTLPANVPAPQNNPLTAEKIKLGERLFNDKALSFDRSLSCASCHDLFDAAGADGRTTATGIDNKIGTRNTPTVWNAAFQLYLFWDGRAVSLEEQAKGPLINPLEMGMPSLSLVESRVQGNAYYQQAFSEIFGKDTRITIDRIAEVIACYERSLVTDDTPYDRFVKGDITALTAKQMRGMALFESMGCVTCHSGPNFSAASVFDSSAPFRIFPAIPSPLEQEFNFSPDDNHSNAIARSVWRVPSLRNVALTGPWLHNGSVSKLEDVVRIMAAAQLGLSGHYLLWSDQLNSIDEIDQPVPSAQQIDDIVAFLHALSSDKLLKNSSL